MPVTLTSPVEGLAVGATYTGPLEAWLLAEGYASQDGYTGPGVANTGDIAIDPANDPTSAENREAPQWPAEKVDFGFDGFANDADHLTETSHPAGGYDYDAGGTNTEAPTVDSIDPAEGAAAGGTEVHIYGANFDGTTGVTFGGTAGTALDVVNDGEIVVTTPAHAAGAVDVVVTNATGNATKAGGYTYA